MGPSSDEAATDLCDDVLSRTDHARHLHRRGYRPENVLSPSASSSSQNGQWSGLTTPSGQPAGRNHSASQRCAVRNGGVRTTFAGSNPGAS